MQTPHYKTRGCGNRRSPPVLILERCFTLLGRKSNNARNTRMSRMSERLRTVGYPGCGPSGVNIRHILDQQRADGVINMQQRLDGGWEDPLRVMTVFNLVLPRVTLRLSDRCSFPNRESGVTMRITLRSSITGRKPLRRAEASHPRVSPKGEPRRFSPLHRPP